MQRIYRMTQRRSFSYVYKKGASLSTPRIVLYSVDAKTLKIGVVVGKKVGNSVVRSRVKRRISERFRLLIPFVDDKKNFIVVARTACADATSAQIEDDLVYLFKKAGVYQKA